MRVVRHEDWFARPLCQFLHLELVCEHQRLAMPVEDRFVVVGNEAAGLVAPTLDADAADDGGDDGSHDGGADQQRDPRGARRHRRRRWRGARTGRHGAGALVSQLQGDRREVRHHRRVELADDRIVGCHSREDVADVVAMTDVAAQRPVRPLDHDRPVVDAEHDGGAVTVERAEATRDADQRRSRRHERRV